MKLKYSQNIIIELPELKEIIMASVLEKAPELKDCEADLRMFFFNEDGESTEVQSLLIKMDRELDA